jgi:hypothetical protein
VSTGFRQPALVKSPEGLGISLPPDLSVAEVARVIGPSFRVGVIDVVAQSELPRQVPLGVFADYMSNPGSRWVCVHVRCGWRVSVELVPVSHALWRLPAAVFHAQPFSAGVLAHANTRTHTQHKNLEGGGEEWEWLVGSPHNKAAPSVLPRTSPSCLLTLHIPGHLLVDTRC